jgi:hypothetical protein
MTNLLYKASIVTTPTAYGVGVLNSIKPAQSFGEELVVNGNFATDSDWTKETGWTISGGKANYNGNAALSALYQFTVTSGVKYRISFDVLNYVSGSFKVYLSDGSLAGGSPLITANGSYVFDITSVGVLVLFRNVTSFIGSIDNVSVVEITDADFDFTRTSSATRVNPDYLIETVSINSANLVQNGNFSELGSQLVTNGDFATDSDWTLGTGWEISNGKANSINTLGFELSQPANYITGKTYKITYTISDYVSGSIRVYYGGTGAGIERSANGTYTEYIAASGSQTLYVRSTIAFTGSIDNVSIKQVDPNDNWIVTDSDANNFVEITQGQARLKFLNASPVTQLATSFVMTAGKKYKLTVDVLTVTSGSIRIAGDGISEVFSVAGTTTRIINPTGNTQIKFYRNTSNVDVTLNSVSLIEIQENGVPRLDYTNGTASILLENQSTNLITYSQDFSNAFWTKTGASVVSDATTSPDGTINADKLVEDTSTGQHNIKKVNSPISSSFYNGKIFVKANGSPKLAFSESGATGSYLAIDLNNGNVLASNLLGSYSVNALPNGWFEVNISPNTANVRFDFAVFLLDANYTTGTPAGYSYTGDGTSGAYIWGAQLEALSYPTSYIPTSGSTVTRAAETLNNAGNSDLINSTEGVLYLEYKPSFATGSRQLTLNDNTYDNRIILECRENGTKLRSLISSGGVTQMDIALVIPSINEFYKIAISYKENLCKFFVNGTQVGTTDISATMPTGLNNLSFSGKNDSSLIMTGNTKCVAVFSEALSDTELACLTSTNNREIFLNYYYRMQYVGANTEALSCAEQTFNI